MDTHTRSTGYRLHTRCGLLHYALHAVRSTRYAAFTALPHRRTYRAVTFWLVYTFVAFGSRSAVLPRFWVGLLQLRFVTCAFAYGWLRCLVYGCYTFLRATPHYLPGYALPFAHTLLVHVLRLLPRIPHTTTRSGYHTLYILRVPVLRYPFTLRLRLRLRCHITRLTRLHYRCRSLTVTLRLVVAVTAAAVLLPRLPFTVYRSVHTVLRYAPHTRLPHVWLRLPTLPPFGSFICVYILRLLVYPRVTFTPFSFTAAAHGYSCYHGYSWTPFTTLLVALAPTLTPFTRLRLRLRTRAVAPAVAGCTPRGLPHAVCCVWFPTHHTPPLPTYAFTFRLRLFTTTFVGSHTRSLHLLCRFTYRYLQFLLPYRLFYTTGCLRLHPHHTACRSCLPFACGSGALHARSRLLVAFALFTALPVTWFALPTFWFTHAPLPRLFWFACLRLVYRAARAVAVTFTAHVFTVYIFGSHTLRLYAHLHYHRGYYVLPVLDYPHLLPFHAYRRLHSRSFHVYAVVYALPFTVAVTQVLDYYRGYYACLPHGSGSSFVVPLHAAVLRSELIRLRLPVTHVDTHTFFAPRTVYTCV